MTNRVNYASAPGTYHPFRQVGTGRPVSSAMYMLEPPAYTHLVTYVPSNSNDNAFNCCPPTLNCCLDIIGAFGQVFCDFCKCCFAWTEIFRCTYNCCVETCTLDCCLNAIRGLGDCCAELPAKILNSFNVCCCIDMTKLCSAIWPKRTLCKIWIVVTALLGLACFIAAQIIPNTEQASTPLFLTGIIVPTLSLVSCIAGKVFDCCCPPGESMERSTLIQV